MTSRINRIIYLLILLVILYFFNPNAFKDIISPKLSPTPTVKIQSASTESAELVKVVRVIDGDTIEIEPFDSAQGNRVRYIGIDTPELHHPKKEVQCFAKEAMEKNKQLVEGREVKLEKDISETDKYKRLLRYVFVQQEATLTPLFVNEYLVKEGYAHAATFPPDVKYQDLFLEAEREARSQNKGLWSKCR